MSSLRKQTKFTAIIAIAFAFLLAAPMVGGDEVQAETECANFNDTYTANVVVFDTAMVFNRLGAQNPNWVMYALERDVINIESDLPLTAGGAAIPGMVALRPDKRPRPLVLRVPRCSKLTINFTNLLTPLANPVMDPDDLDERLEEQGLECVNNNEGGPGAPACPDRAEGAFGPAVIINNQVKTRFAGVHVAGMQLDAANGIANDSSNVGANGNSCVGQDDGPTSFTFLAEHEGAFKLSNPCAAIGGEASGGNNGLGMWGMVAVQPKGARIYRSQVYEEELRLAADANFNGLIDNLLDGSPGDEMLDSGHPIIDYAKRYPNLPPWTLEGKANLPILSMIDPVTNEIVHSEINAIVAGPNSDGTFDPDTYPLENEGIRNPTVPYRLQPFRDWASMFHDETATADAFEGYFKHPVLSHTLHGVRDSFMINYASGGIGSEIIANRLGVGPMYDCLGCAYEEFFLTSFTVGDPGMRVDVPANFGLEQITPEQIASATLFDLAPLVGPKATTALFQDDPANIHNSYTGDNAKFRNLHAGPKEQHIFHLHNHQWLFNANDDRANYLDAQGIGPGSSYTYEINFGGSGNRNKTAGDAIFHCHFYPHFAQGMWYHWRIHDVMETGTILEASVTDGAVNNYHDEPFELGMSKPALASDAYTAGLIDFDPGPLGLADARVRAHPDGEILAGIPIAAVVPLPGKPMAPMPGDVVLVTKDSDGNAVPDSSQNYVVDRSKNPGYPFWIAGLDCSDGVSGVFDPTCAQAVVGQRPPTPPMDMLPYADAKALLGLPGGTAGISPDPFFQAFCDDPDTVPVEDCLTDPLSFATAFVNAAGGFDGGLPRHSIGGCKDSASALVPGCPHVPNLIPEIGNLYVSSETRLDFHKEVLKAKGIIFPEEGTDLEKLAMAHHATRNHPSTALNLDGDPPSAGNFVQNGLPPVPGAPFNDPCISDTGQALVGGQSFDFFGSGLPGAGGDEFFQGPITEGRAWDVPFTYAAANIQIDAVFNKVGYHYPQQRIIALWSDVLPTINKLKAPEPFVMRLNTFNCAKYQHSNLVPKEFEVDDYQVRTPTDIIGQHIHLPKWDLTTADGAANGWNYEDGTLSPGMVRERIEAINNYNDLNNPGTPHFVAQPHPALGSGVGNEWKGGRVTLQRWFIDPVVDRDERDRGLGIIFTHDHYGPSTHQQIGLYSTLLTEPAESTWVHNETGVQLGTRQMGCGDPNLACDGGPTSWQAAILPGDFSAAQGEEPFREFYFEFSDFQHAYEAGIYVGAGRDGRPGPDHEPPFIPDPADEDCEEDPEHPDCTKIPNPIGGTNTAFPVTADSFRHAINPSFRQQAICKPGPGAPPECAAGSPFPDIVRYPAVCDAVLTPRPCPEAISADDIGMFVANYRNEPVGLRVFDPFSLGPDNQPGTQTAGLGGDLAFALATPPLLVEGSLVVVPGTDTPIPGRVEPNFRAIPQMNIQPQAGDTLLVGGNDARFDIDGDTLPDPFYVDDECPGCTKIATDFPPPINDIDALIGGDPFTPMLRTYPGDLVRIKVQNGATEHEHDTHITGVKWVQGNSGFGPERLSGGWQSFQNPGISEQFNFVAPINSDVRAENPDEFDDRRGTDHAYILNTGQDGYWTGVWGLLRSYTGGTPPGAGLHQLPGGFDESPSVRNRNDFVGVCPKDGTRPNDPPLNLREYTVIAMTANEILDNQLGATITGNLPDGADVLHVGGPLDPEGGTLVYNPRGGDGVNQEAQFNGPLHDPTALLFVLAEDLEPLDPFDPACGGVPARGNRDPVPCDETDDGCGVENPDCQVTLRADAPLEPLVLRAIEGECVEVTLFNRLPDNAPDLAGYNTLLQMVLRDRQAEPQPGEPANSVTTFNNNLIRPSSFVGLHAQNVEYDATKHHGIVVGGNIANVVASPESVLAGVFPDRITFRYFAGHIEAEPDGNRVNMRETPVEFGGSNLTPADVLKQGQKGMIGALVIEPAGATWANSDGASPDDLASLEQVRNRQDGGLTDRGTRADMTVTVGGSHFEDLVLMKQAGMNHRHKDGEAVPNIASEGQGLPEDSHDAGQKGANYGTEPAWFRFGLPADVDFGNAMAGLGAVDADQMFANSLAGGQYPWTPVFTAPSGQEVRLRVLQPTGVGRGSTFDLHGHVWARDPYLPENPACLTAASGLGDGTPLNAGGSGCGLSSVTIGDNPLSWYLGGQESWTPMSHFTVRVPAGGVVGVEGDYLFRDHASFGVTDGVWGIMRAQ